MEVPVKALVEITKLRHYLMILSSFILFFSIIPVWESGLDRHNLLIGAIFFFVSSIVFWIGGSLLDIVMKNPKDQDNFGVQLWVISFCAWISLLICSFVFIAYSV